MERGFKFGEAGVEVILQRTLQQDLSAWEWSGPSTLGRQICGSAEDRSRSR